MRGGFEIIVGQALEHVTHIDDDLIFARDDVEPLIFHVKDLQATRTGTDQQSDQVDVFMLFSPDCGLRLLRDRRIMNRPQDAIPFLDFFVKIGLIQMEIQGYSLEQFGSRGLKRFI